ncbi:hypothetical protein HMPREF0765_2089 [Sphingobacterium spiritivorum ATCC 33300]|uniref:Uncharacterized protein n=1 Tax=Sphingobacterium spiritivorum ATCC 33300 TaxID=525372 RepID=C2FXN3_SPHSI|nr:hypothetical protein HMPREF0765_2089 [Sphingobacterium spiritivorum ATCC 33300]
MKVFSTFQHLLFFSFSFKHDLKTANKIYYSFIISDLNNITNPHFIFIGQE